MTKEAKKANKKRIRKMQKGNKQVNKNKSNILEEIEKIELPLIDLKTSKKGQGEKSYAIYLIKEIITICNNVINEKICIPPTEYYDSLVDELIKMCICDTWYYYEKINELVLSEQEVNLKNILKYTSKKHIVNWNNYVLNTIERTIIHINMYTLLARSLICKIWDEKNWKFTRCNMQSLLIMLINGVEEKEILDVEIGFNDIDEAIALKIQYGGIYINSKNLKIEEIARTLFGNKEWKWIKYDKNLNITNVGTDIEDIIYLEGGWVHERGNSIYSSTKVESKPDYISILEEGIKLKHLGKYEEAKEMYIKAISMDNTHPNGYYNLGKVLYILGNYKASAKAYKAAYERGICELTASTTINHITRLDVSSLYIHLGHALLDEEYITGEYEGDIHQYQQGIDPFKINGYTPKRGRVRNTAYDQYDKLCVTAAREYLERSE